MKSAEITDVALDSIQKRKHDFIRINYPNGDMVGHTGDLLAVEISVEATDLSIGRLMKAIEKAGGVLVVTADHGNADEMYEVDKKTGTIKIDEATVTMADIAAENGVIHVINQVLVPNVTPGSPTLPADLVTVAGYDVTRLGRDETLQEIARFALPDKADPGTVLLGRAR